MPTAPRWLLLLLLLPAALIPGAASGLVLCIDSGPGSHLAIEWASCCESPGTGDTASAECGDCRDIPLDPAFAKATVRPNAPAQVLAPPSPAPSILAALPASSAEGASPRRASAAPRAPRLPLRI